MVGLVKYINALTYRIRTTFYSIASKPFAPKFTLRHTQLEVDALLLSASTHLTHTRKDCTYTLVTITNNDGIPCNQRWFSLMIIDQSISPLLDYNSHTYMAMSRTPRWYWRLFAKISLFWLQGKRFFQSTHPHDGVNAPAPRIDCPKTKPS
jgi:hypothetical protein